MSDNRPHPVGPDGKPYIPRRGSGGTAEGQPGQTVKRARRALEKGLLSDSDSYLVRRTLAELGSLSRAIWRAIEHRDNAGKMQAEERRAEILSLLKLILGRAEEYARSGERPSRLMTSRPSRH